MNEYNPKKEWTLMFKEKKEMMYPSEYVIRIFKGKYPKLDFSTHNFTKKKICDIGCGDGRHLVFLNQCGFDTYGTEISDEIVDKVKNNLKKLDSSTTIKQGTNNNIPFDNDFFDYLLSWNSCYYMGDERNFSNYIKEFARVLKKDGYLILSIPKNSSFIFKESKDLGGGFRIIQNDPFNVRNGEVLRLFIDEKEIQEVFSTKFGNFVFGSIHDDCFGFNYHWHLVVCQKL